VILFQRLLDCGSPPQANWSSRGEKEHHTLVIGRTIKLLCKRGEIPFVDGCQPASRWSPVIPADQQHGDKCSEPQHVLNLQSFHVLPGKKGCDHLREKDDQQNDGSSDPQHGDT
jgi:hypothetical protein